tara:strand:+ start:2278 stop:2532 length:255 start_codon:yes stop_codon:yes gene_type:complete
MSWLIPRFESIYPVKQGIFIEYLIDSTSEKIEDVYCFVHVGMLESFLLFWSGETTIPFLPGGSRVVTAVGVAEYFIALFLSQTS